VAARVSLQGAAAGAVSNADQLAAAQRRNAFEYANFGIGSGCTGDSAFVGATTSAAKAVEHNSRVSAVASREIIRTVISDRRMGAGRCGNEYALGALTLPAQFRDFGPLKSNAD